MNAVRPAHDHDFADVVLGSAVPVVVGFCAADPSVAGEPLIDVLDELATSGDEVAVVRVNVEEAPHTSSAYGVSAVPSVVVFHGGTMVLALPGVPSSETVLHMLRVALPSSAPAAAPR